ELRFVRVRRTGDRGQPGDARNLGIGVIEEDPVADLHPVTHEVPGLVVAHAIPGLGADALEIVDGERVRFGLHQPVSAGLALHFHSRNRWVVVSVQTASRPTSQSAVGMGPACCTSKAAPTSQGGAGRSRRKAKLRSYQPPPIPSRLPARSNPTSGRTTIAMSPAARVEAGSRSGSGIP